MVLVAPGKVLNGKWTLGRHLGTGGGGAVYEGTHRNGSRAAVKILHPELAANDDLVGRFLREGYIANHVGHDGVVAALDDDCSEEGLVYLVLELLEGRTLADVLEERATLPIPEALAMSDKILDVLAAAHRKQIIHRDVKPENVFVTKGGAIKVLDFGIARAGALERTPPNIHTTRAGAVVGTPGFMAPEQARGRSELVDPRTDLWAAAAVLYRMLTGQRLHEAATTNEALVRAMLEPAPPIATVRPEVPVGVARVVDRGLAFNRERRFQSAEEMQGAVRFLLRSYATLAPPLSPSPSLPPSLPPSPAPNVRFRAVVAAAVAITSLFAAVAAWLASDLEPPPIAGRGIVMEAAPATAAPTAPAAPSEPAPPALSTAPPFVTRASSTPSARPRSSSPPLPASSDPLSSRR